MPKLELKLDNVHAHGFPYACMMCGSDENPTPRSKKFYREDGLAGCGCALLFGPIGWLVGLLWLLIRSGGRKHTFPIPLCDCCEQARMSVRNRGLALLLLGLGLMFSPLAMATLSESLMLMSFWSGLLVIVGAGIDQAMCRSQFNFRTLKTDADRVVLEIPNDDYPSIYQRHLDTAVLYGSVEHMGTTEPER